LVSALEGGSFHYIATRSSSILVDLVGRDTQEIRRRMNPKPSQGPPHFRLRSTLTLFRSTSTHSGSGEPSLMAAIIHSNRLYETATKLVSPDRNRGKLGMHALAAFLRLLVSAGCFKGKGDRKVPPSLGLNLSPVEVFSDFPVSSLPFRFGRGRVSRCSEMLSGSPAKLVMKAKLAHLSLLLTLIAAVVIGLAGRPSSIRRRPSEITLIYAKKTKPWFDTGFPPGFSKPTVSEAARWFVPRAGARGFRR